MAQSKISLLILQTEASALCWLHGRVPASTARKQIGWWFISIYWENMPHAYIHTDASWGLRELIIHVLYSRFFFFFNCAIDWFWHGLHEKLLFVLHWGLLTDILHHHHAYSVSIMNTWSCIILKEIFTVEAGNGGSTHNFDGKPFIQPQCGYNHFNFSCLLFKMKPIQY